ncbi:MAG: DinB family protein [Planctomycetota bacterium]
MFDNHTLGECFQHDNWTRSRIYGYARALTAEQLRQPFELGAGSLLATFRHIYGAERIWLERWRGELPPFPPSSTITELEELARVHDELAEMRAGLIAELDNEALQQSINYVDPQEKSRNVPLGGLLLHVYNHNVHHRAQTLNMLRRLGVQVDMLDFLVFRAEQPTVAWEPSARTRAIELGLAVGPEPVSPARLSTPCLFTYYSYNDWANTRLFSVSKKLDDEQLDRTFDIGLGTLRRTLVHLYNADQWWYENWTAGGKPEFDELPQTTSVSELEQLLNETSAKRNEFLADCGDDDLQREVGAWVRPDARFCFRLGESMLQVCTHGTHHRAQALNMLRQLGVELPSLELVDWLDQQK